MLMVHWRLHVFLHIFVYGKFYFLILCFFVASGLRRVSLPVTVSVSICPASNLRLVFNMYY